ncbi:fumarate reductase flavoprotein subunit [Klebsiella pneumoniae subsp. ozaenae]|uniref:Fumarate reductase flavoprotein subunit n=1 Tax=Klebsiella pneumoniae subsp. ozaenae TaxID=574 RepID=A0A378B0Z0_KLEPO|nr:fumarate reductase flavoprotein subunit [Klebsiella pneumoniae subsp. ozaenae]
MNMMEGTLVQIRANAVVLATGGAGRVYRYNTNGGIVTGDGMGDGPGPMACRCATWNSFSITRPACRAPGS